MRRSLAWQIKDLAKAAGIILLFTMPFWTGCATLWVGASAVTSGIKTFSDDCGKRYPVEVVLGGDWFCAETENE